jgi:hypothetical protein
MAHEFFKIAKFQVQKHNSRYVKTHLLVRSCFTEVLIGRVVARFLLNEDEYKVPDPPGTAEILLEEVNFFHSPIQELHPKQFKSWLENMSGGAKLDIRESDGVFHQYKNLIIKVLACGVDIWSKQEHHLPDGKNILSRFCAQPSTTHHVERGVKLGSHLASTGRSELKVAQYDAMASNGFKGETPTEIREKDLEDNNKKRMKGDTRGLPKLKDIEASVRSIGKRLVGVAWKLGGGFQFSEVRKQFAAQWTDKSTSFLTQRSKDKKNSIMLP